VLGLISMGMEAYIVSYSMVVSSATVQSNCIHIAILFIAFQHASLSALEQTVRVRQRDILLQWATMFSRRRVSVRRPNNVKCSRFCRYL